MINQRQQNEILRKLKPFGPSKIGVFGSYARDEQDEKSDLDLLISLKKRINLFELLSLEEELSNLLGIEVELVTEDAVNKHIKPYIDKDVVYILND